MELMTADGEERGDSPKKLEAIRAQRQAISMVNKEMQRLYTPQEYRLRRLDYLDVLEQED